MSTKEIEKTIFELILAGFTPDAAIDFAENQPFNAAQFAAKVAEKIKK